MTSHELAMKLLDQPDVPVCINEYTGGYTPIREIGEVNLKVSVYAGQYVLLETRGPDFE